MVPEPASVTYTESVVGSGGARTHTQNYGSMGYFIFKVLDSEKENEIVADIRRMLTFLGRPFSNPQG